MKKDKEFESKLMQMMDEEIPDVISYSDFKFEEKQTKYSNQIVDLETKMKNLVKTEEMVEYLKDFKYALTQHILIIKKEDERKMFRKGLEFGKLFSQKMSKEKI